MTLPAQKSHALRERQVERHVLVERLHQVSTDGRPKLLERAHSIIKATNADEDQALAQHSSGADLLFRRSGSSNSNSRLALSTFEASPTPDTDTI